jgi:hypothetical protein
MGEIGVEGGGLDVQVRNNATQLVIKYEINCSKFGWQRGACQRTWGIRTNLV